MKKLTTEEFIIKSKLVHGDSYDYSKSIYLNSRSKITIICNIHGEFIQSANTHLMGLGCPNCSKCNTKTFISKATKIHNNKYNYDKVNCFRSTDKVIIICPIHGEFEQQANSHLQGSGCKECKIDNNKLTQDEFKTKALVIHNNKYNYDKVNYINVKTKVVIICPEHGEFEQNPNNHLKGQGCPICGGTSKSNIIDFISKSNNIHNFKYNYDNSDYVNNITKLNITCPIHGEFWQTPKLHLQGSGCPECGSEITCNKNKSNYDDFILKSNLIHSNKYVYLNQNFKGLNYQIKIICKKHGEFLQIANNHLKGHGCPICNYSKGELVIYNWLKENNIPFKSQFELITDEIARNSNLMIIDFFVKYKEQQYFIEYDGKQHYEYIPFFHQGGIIDFEKQQRRDKVLNEFCELHKDKVTLIRFKYDENDEEIINKLNEILNESKKEKN